MTNEPTRRAVDSRRSERLEEAARLASLRATIDRLRLEGVDDSSAAALKAAAEKLEWLATFSAYDDEAGADVQILGVGPLSLWMQFVEVSEVLIRSVETAESDLQAGVPTPGEVERILELTVDLLKQASSIADLNLGYDRSVMSTIRRALDERFVEASAALSTYRVVQEKRVHVERLKEVADSQAELAGDDSEVKLSTEFDLLSRREGFTANVFRGLTITLFLVVIAYSAYIAFSAPQPSLEMVQKLAVGLPVLLLAGYFGREAGQHRKTARWSSIVGVQLRSVRAYTAGLDDDQTRMLRAEFGRRVFMETPSTSDGSSGGASPGQLDPGLLRELTELVRVAQQASGPRP